MANQHAGICRCVAGISKIRRTTAHRALIHQRLGGGIAVFRLVVRVAGIFLNITRAIVGTAPRCLALVTAVVDRRTAAFLAVIYQTIICAAELWLVGSALTDPRAITAAGHTFPTHIAHLIHIAPAGIAVLYQILIRIAEVGLCRRTPSYWRIVLAGGHAIKCSGIAHGSIRAPAGLAVGHKLGWCAIGITEEWLSIRASVSRRTVITERRGGASSVRCLAQFTRGTAAIIAIIHQYPIRITVERAIVRASA